ncbi:MAG: hypothetical protein BWX70_02902 [Verrucomicrobia bacterium ADurb.Bin070]|nr:MAG: hypothetical protein BWX70_02902 [Verrucomicrobia bacterium ADurb.Bin070]
MQESEFTMVSLRIAHLAFTLGWHQYEWLST